MEHIAYATVYKRKYKRKKPLLNVSGITRILYIPRVIDELLKLEHFDRIEFCLKGKDIILRKA